MADSKKRHWFYITISTEQGLRHDEVVADEVAHGTKQVKFHLSGELVAAYQLENIAGWYRGRNPVDDSN